MDEDGWLEKCHKMALCLAWHSWLHWRVHDGTLFIERLAQRRAAHSRLLSNYANARSLSRTLLSFSPCSNVGRVCTHQRVGPIRREREKGRKEEKRERRECHSTNVRRMRAERIISRAVPTHGAPAAHQGRRRAPRPTTKTSSGGIRRRFP